ncbi:SPX domain-containing protein [Cokeromyces recurvatus]|uniref:SPX domain-containing protein n=1 Tax=Cokeromyces recurvatus TaxID=90255 RepID=UPI002220D86C|nr:SPX domain-containing protein [Cokeromyces recurvatus]KAI7903758.1 SPX domain-containing protein [Cokeromyces recurvatus]
MKFGKQMETASFDLPENWRPHLIHYKTLKKSIRLIVDELESRGLSTEWISTLDTVKTMRLDYIMDGDMEDIHPFIKITIDDPMSITAVDKPALLNLIPVTQRINTEPLSIKIELVRDSEFFHLLVHELSHAAALHEKEKTRFINDVDKLESQLTIAASPERKDLYNWREIFSLYMEAAIFKNETNEKYATESYKRSQEKLQWFTDELSRMNLTKRMTTRQSRIALAQFMAINAQLVHFKHFQSLNQTAIIKILKKHDKRSGLCASSEFSSFTKDNAIFIEGILTSLFNAIQTKLITIVPQPDDYDCPVCFSIAWRPIRLECGHVFCVRCLIKAHKKRLYDCPICRQEHAVGNADANNLDTSLQDFMLLYFPKEIKEKRKENQQEQMMLSKQMMKHHHHHHRNNHSRLPLRRISPPPPSHNANTPQRNKSCFIM